MLLQTFEVILLSMQVVWIILQLIVSAFLLVKMFQTKQYNLLPLILFFILNSIRMIIYAFTPYIILYLIIIQIPNILLLIFIKLTFFRNKKSPFKFFLITLILVRSIDLWIRLQYGITIPMREPLDESYLIYYYSILLSISLSFLFSHLWLGIVSIKYYKSLKSIKIEPWIKKRYQIIGIASIIYAFSIFLYYVIPYNFIPGQDLFSIIFVAILTSFVVFYSSAMFIAWVMPTRLKTYFNKDYQIISDKEFEENELLELIKEDLKKNSHK
ncbi:MAG: hypothetical protein EU532_10900 [Promethearchaeota archaeon]|nr:MAG: hypothetical protein EU532_10900 [Candidatus Lokiarchaeota archaeon]